MAESNLDYVDKVISDYNEVCRQAQIMREALRDILTADETSTLAGAVAIAKHALEQVDE